MAIPDWLLYAAIALAVVVSLILVRRWSYNIAISFECEGREYTRHRDGHFTDGQGGRIVDPDQIARLIPVSEAAKKERFRSMDAQRR
jgi:hypothetical protein